MSKKNCQFCNSINNINNPVYYKYGVYVCRNCLSNGSVEVVDIDNEYDVKNKSYLELDFNQISPKILKNKLDEYVIGQDLSLIHI